MKGPLGLLQLLCIIFLSKLDTTECRFLDFETTGNLRPVTLPEGYSTSPGDNAAYKLYTDKKTWRDARARCISDGGDLANVATLEKRNRILNVIPLATGWVHVGIFKPAGGQEWISVHDGSPVTSSLPWHNYDAPDNAWNGGGIFPADGDMKNYVGFFQANSICEKRIDGRTEETAHASPGITLPEGYSIYPGDNAAYKVYTDNKTWDEARARCISDGGDLANVATLEKRNRMLNVIPQVLGWVHVGIYKPAGGQEWISVHNGLPVTSPFPWFRYDAPDNAWNGGAIFPADGDMKNFVGIFPANSVCEKRIDEKTEETTQASPAIALPEGYSIYPGDNAAYKLYTDNKTWDEARARCISDGGDLANVATPEKRNRMRYVIPQARQWVHVGIYKPTGGQEWISVQNGLPVTSSLRWSQYDAPDNAWNGGAIFPADGDLTNFNGFQTKNSVCEIRIVENKTDKKTEETTRASPGIPLSDGYSTYPGDNVAYKLYTDKKTWRDARARCISDGGDLANVATLEKRNRMLNVIPQVLGWVHVGIYKPAGGQEWISVDTGLPVTSSLPWHNYDAPDNAWNGGAIFPTDGDMTNYVGFFPANSICEKRIDKRTEETTRAPPGITLPEGYITHPGDNAAYKLYSDKKTWREARNRCISDGGDLANVATLEKRNRMLNVIPKVNEFVYVGIFKPTGGQEWISVDTGLPVTSSLPWFRYDAPDNAWNGGAIWPADGDMTNLEEFRTKNSVCEIRIAENNRRVDGPLDNQPIYYRR